MRGVRNRLNSSTGVRWRPHVRKARNDGSVAASLRLRSPDHRHVVQAARIARDAGRSVTADRIASVLSAGLAFLDED